MLVKGSLDDIVFCPGCNSVSFHYFDFQSSESDPLLSFIKQAVPRARINQGLAADLKYKIHYLDNDIGFKKHRFDKSAAKKKILSAREKRKLKLMKLDLKKQEYK